MIRAHRTSSKISHAFTLVELIVVLAAFFLLAALLLPILRNSRDRGEQLRCMAHVRQLTQIVVGPYVKDHRLLLPKVKTIMGLHEALSNYVASAEVFRCPADRGSDGPVVPSSANCYEEFGSSYAFASAEADGAGVSNCIGVRITNIELPTRKVIIFEPPLFHQEGSITGSDQWHVPFRASVVGFLDGHADFVHTNYVTPDAAHSYY